MGNLFIVYTALTVFGLGITLIDFLGVFDHAGDDAGDGGDGDDDGAPETGHGDEAGHNHGSQLGSGNAGIRGITAILGLLRLGVYFALGAGPTGLFALFTGLSRGQSLIWSAGAGIGIALFTRLLRKFLRRDLDSSIKSEELLMEKAVILAPVNPGEMGKALVRRFGTETEIYVRCRNGKAAFPKGAEVRITEYDESVYWIE
ncbi:hypothetical protein AGMMS49546_23430 [Spirochaetia bacterium]|nr:hypothetical protein AGMMS49546_23430 [Spirochaetia bacterium]